MTSAAAAVTVHFQLSVERSGGPPAETGVVPGEAVDALTEALVRSGTPAARAEVIHRLTEELCEIIANMQPAEPAIGELISLEGIRVAARYHLHHMNQSATLSGGER